MQYLHRRLQRSVTERRRYVISLEKPSFTKTSFSGFLRSLALPLFLQRDPEIRPFFLRRDLIAPGIRKACNILHGDLRVHNDNFDVMVGLSNTSDSSESIPQLTRDNWREAFAAQIKAYKEGGFDRVNPSILKADIISAYPDFNERAIGFKRFSDVMKQLEKDGLVVVEMDEQNTMLIKLL